MLTIALLVSGVPGTRLTVRGWSPAGTDTIEELSLACLGITVLEGEIFTNPKTWSRCCSITFKFVS